MARYPHDTDDDEVAAKKAPALKMPEPKVLGSITWLGEGEGGPRSNEWNGYTFRVGEAVEVDSPRMLDKAANNRFYKVTDNRPKDQQPKPITNVEPPTHVQTAAEAKAEAAAEAKDAKADADKARRADR